MLYVKKLRASNSWHRIDHVFIRSKYVCVHLCLVSVLLFPKLDEFVVSVFLAHSVITIRYNNNRTVILYAM